MYPFLAIVLLANDSDLSHPEGSGNHPKHALFFSVVWWINLNLPGVEKNVPFRQKNLPKGRTFYISRKSWYESEKKNSVNKDSQVVYFNHSDLKKYMFLKFDLIFSNF